MKKIVSFGEILIDFIPLDKNNSSYEKNPGGAPANVAVGLSRLGVDTSFIGKVGNDLMGDFLLDVLEKNGVGIDGVSKTDEARTSLVFVNLDDNGERSFSFYIDPRADELIEEKDIKEEFFQNSSIFHFGSISLIKEPCASATKRSINLAKDNNALISFDPNIRFSLWKDKETAKKEIISMLPKADILKISEEEFTFLTGQEEVNEKTLQFFSEFDIKIIFITFGGEGSAAFYEDNFVFQKGEKVKAVDTTGAGDAFLVGALYKINEKLSRVDNLSKDDFIDILTFANKMGAFAVSKKGAMTALPWIEEINSVKL